MRRRSMSRARGCCENPLTTFTNEQAAYIVVGGTLLASVLGYMLYKAGMNAQQITDLQAQLPTSQPSTPATTGG